MRRSRDEREAEVGFASDTGRASSDAMRVLERIVIGGDFGANAYTTLAQADLIAERLRLGGGDRLLDVGAERGWPGLCLVKVTGSMVVLDTARRRAVLSPSGDRLTAVAASVRRLPFAQGGLRRQRFQTDVLSRLTAKLSVLRASRRLLRPGGRTVS